MTKHSQHVSVMISFTIFYPSHWQGQVLIWLHLHTPVFSAVAKGLQYGSSIFSWPKWSWGPWGSKCCNPQGTYRTATKSTKSTFFGKKHDTLHWYLHVFLNSHMPGESYLIFHGSDFLKPHRWRVSKNKNNIRSSLFRCLEHVWELCTTSTIRIHHWVLIRNMIHIQLLILFGFKQQRYFHWYFPSFARLQFANSQQALCTVPIFLSSKHSQLCMKLWYQWS